MATCETCGNAIDHKHGHVCLSCICDYDEEINDCANCGGEGYTYGCGWDWQCYTYDEGEGTCLCTRPCEWCQTPTPDQIDERRKLQQVLSDALHQPKENTDATSD